MSHHLDTHSPMGPDEIHCRALRELLEGLTKPFSIIYQQSWLTCSTHISRASDQEKEVNFINLRDIKNKLQISSDYKIFQLQIQNM